MIIEDLDGEHAGYGAFWGEVQSAIHRGLGALGVITDGSVRDIDQWAPDFQFLAAKIGPSHAYVHAVDFGGEVDVLGMRVASGDIVHADRHGAVVVPAETVLRAARRGALVRTPRSAASLPLRARRAAPRTSSCRPSARPTRFTDVSTYSYNNGGNHDRFDSRPW